MIVASVILGYIMFGVVCVYLAGVLDKKFKNSHVDELILGFLVIVWPVFIFLVLMFLVGCTLNFIYEKGRK